MKLITTILLLLLLHGARAQEFIPLWPEGKKPNSNGKKITDSVSNERIWRVATPGIYAFRVPRSENKGTSVLICPGGGYERLSHIYNGFQFARWFNSQGINAFVLIYRLPHQEDLLRRQEAPQQDAQRALRLLRARSTEWALAPDRIGLMGISAGGHVASTVGTHSRDLSAIGDSVDHFSYRPDFLLLLSPVITMGTGTHRGSRRHFLGPDTSAARVREYSNETQVSTYTPPTFIVHAQNDSTVPVKNSLLFYQALNDAGIEASMHIFPQGGHGIKLVDNPGSTALWLSLLSLWLDEQKFISPIKK